MSQEKTEKATPKKREDARKKGQIARGPEFPAALSFLGALLVLNIFSGEVFGWVGGYIVSSAGHIAKPEDLTAGNTQVLLIEAAKILALIALPVMTIAFAAVVAGNFAQGGLSLTGAALAPKPEKFNPVNNIKRVFGLDSVVNLIKSIIKLLLIGAVGYGVLAPVIENAPELMHSPLPVIAAKLGATLYTLALRCGLVMIALACADYGYAWYKNEKSLKMSKQEIIDEYKQQEGDPLVKNQRRNAARAIAQKRSLAEVPTASVIITNPTHISVALRYDRDKDAAPIVVAVGADNIAAKIREIARENDIPMIENVPLARALYKVAEPNRMIPVEFFGAVAEILAYVFRQKSS